MTLSELLHKVTFEELIPFMFLFEDYDWNLASYKMHYDYLCHLSEIKTEPKNKSINTPLSRKEKLKRPFEPCSFDVNGWRIALAKELATEVTVNNSLAETAAGCLWNTLHHYGFSEYQNTELEQLFNRNLERNACRYRKMYQKYIPSKKVILSVKSFHQTIRRVMKEYRKFIPLKEEDRVYSSHNKSRDWRYWKRWEIKREYNKRICEAGAFIEDLQNRGQNIVVPPDLDYLSVLFKANHCLIKRWRSYAYDTTNRYGYFRDLIENYNLLFWIRHPNSILCVSSSMDYPLTVEEMDLVRLIVGNRNGENVFCVKTDNSLGEEFRIDAAFYTV